MPGGDNPSGLCRSSLTLASLSHKKAMISMKDIKPVGGPLRPCSPPPAPVAAAIRASRVADRAWRAAGTCHCSESFPAGLVALVEGSLDETKPQDRPEWGSGRNISVCVDLSALHPHDAPCRKYESRSVCCISQRLSAF